MYEIVYHGKPLPVSFGLKTLTDFCKSTGTDFDKVMRNDGLFGGFDDIVTLTRFGLNDGARRRGDTERYSDDDVWDIFTDTPSLIMTVTDIFSESITPLVDKLGALGEEVKNSHPTATIKGQPSQ